MLNPTAILLLFATVALAQNRDGDLESVIDQIFGKPGDQNQNGGTQNDATQNGGNQNGGNTPLFPVTSGPLPQPQSQPSTIVPPIQPRPSTIVPPPGISDAQGDTSCLTDNNEVGECVRYYLCNNNNTIINDGIGIIDIRVRDGPCPSYLETCCLAPDQRPPTDPITPPPDHLQQREGCGWRNPDGIGFRTTGDTDGESKFGEFPWMVAILKIEPVNNNEPEGQKLNVYVGGGSLLHPSIVLTAAHYVSTAHQLRVRAGEWDTQTTKEIHPYQDRDVAKVEVHKDFNKGNLFYDVALLFLATPMDLAPNVGVVCLPPPGQRAVAGTRCFASGWGKDKFGKEGRYQVILKKIELPVVERNQCQEALRRTRLGRFFQLHSSFMCAGGEAGRDTCKGDGGSPLVCPIEYEKDRYVQNGIVAWGIGCGEDGTPGVYVDVATLRNWIDDKYEKDRYVQNGIVAWGIGCGEDGTPGVYVDVATLRNWIDDKVKGNGYEISSYSYTF